MTPACLLFFPPDQLGAYKLHDPGMFILAIAPDADRLAEGHENRFPGPDGSQVFDDPSVLPEIRFDGYRHDRDMGTAGEFYTDGIEFCRDEFQRSGALGKHHDRISFLQKVQSLRHDDLKILPGVGPA